MKRHIDHLFVYGTLRVAAGHDLQRELGRHARRLGEGRVAGRLYDLGRYPGLVPDRKDGDVIGDVYRLGQSRALLAVLDRYEACAPRMPAPREYRRIPIQVHWKRRRLWAWVYVYGRPTQGLRVLPGGDYLHGIRGRRLRPRP